MTQIHNIIAYLSYSENELSNLKLILMIEYNISIVRYVDVMKDVTFVFRYVSGMPGTTAPNDASVLVDVSMLLLFQME